MRNALSFMKYQYTPLPALLPCAPPPTSRHTRVVKISTRHVTYDIHAGIGIGIAEGHSQKENINLDVHLIDFRGINQPRTFFFLADVLPCIFLRFSARE
jgi:hypothetical protein